MNNHGTLTGFNAAVRHSFTAADLSQPPPDYCGPIVTEAHPAETVPEIDATGFSVGQLFETLTDEKAPKHCWVRIGRARHRITPESRKNTLRGLFLAVEILGK